VDMVQIKQEFQRQYGQTLESFIEVVFEPSANLYSHLEIAYEMKTSVADNQMSLPVLGLGFFF